MTAKRAVPRMKKGHGDPKFCSCPACKKAWRDGKFNAKGEWEAASSGAMEAPTPSQKIMVTSNPLSVKSFWTDLWTGHRVLP